MTIEQEQKYSDYYQRNLRDEVERVLYSPCVSSRGLSQSSTLKQIVLPKSQPEAFFANRVSLYAQKSQSRPQSTLMLSGLQSPSSELEDRATKRVEKTFLRFVHDNQKR